MGRLDEALVRLEVAGEQHSRLVMELDKQELTKLLAALTAAKIDIDKKK